MLFESVHLVIACLTGADPGVENPDATCNMHAMACTINPQQLSVFPSHQLTMDSSHMLLTLHQTMLWELRLHTPVIMGLVWTSHLAMR